MHFSYNFLVSSGKCVDDRALGAAPHACAKCYKSSHGTTLHYETMVLHLVFHRTCGNVVKMNVLLDLSPRSVLQPINEFKARPDIIHRANLDVYQTVQTNPLDISKGKIRNNA